MRYEVETDVPKVANELIRLAADAKDPLLFLAIVTMGGDRHLCCDEAVSAYDRGDLVGAATIAPKGESGADMPEVVGLFVLEKWRRQGVGRELLLRALARCRDRSLVPLRLNVLSRAASSLVKGLPPDALVDVTVDDKSHLSLF